MRKSSLDLTRTRRSKHPFQRTLPSENNSNVMNSTINSENQHRFNFTKDQKKLESKGKLSMFQSDTTPNFLQQLRKLNGASNVGKNLTKFTEILKKSNSSEIQQMIGTLVKKVPRNNEIQKMFAKILKKQPILPKKPKMKNKKTQTKPPKIPKSKSASSFGKSSIKKRPPKKPLKTKTKQNDSEKNNRQKRGRIKNKSSKSSFNASPFRTNNLGGQSLIFGTGETKRESLYTTKSANNLDEQPKSSKSSK